MARSNNNNKLKAFVRFDGSGRVVSSSLIVQAFKPKVGNWKEIDAKECCNYTTTTTTVAPTTTNYNNSIKLNNMALKSLFPDEMMENKGSSSLTLETIAGKLSYFYEELHLLHFQTTSFAEHEALGKIYDKVGDFQDEIIEKIMGYTGKRVRAYKIDALKDYSRWYA